MIMVLRYRELSVLYLLFSVDYVLSRILEALVLREHISLLQVFGVAVIILGLAFISMPEESKRG